MGSGSPTTLSDGRLAARWAELRQQGRPALIPYITAGYPDAEQTRAVLRGAARAGADMLELGVPWSDPVADGPVIQASSHAALAGGMSLPGVLDLLEAAPPELPVILFSYLNPILAYGPGRLAKDARRRGAAALLVTDLPVGADPAVERELKSAGLPLVRLVAPTSPAARVAAIASASEGFVYLLARTGVTGAHTDIGGELEDRIALVRQATRLPVAVGFGIRAGEQAARVGRVADGVAVGTALVERMGSGGAAAALGWLGELRTALDGARRAA